MPALGSYITASWADLNYDSDLSASALLLVQVKNYFLSGAASLSNFDPDAVRGFVFASGSLGY
jgi:hypothetical protein